MPENAAAVVALFPGAEELLEAIAKVRARNPGRLEAYTPYPVHGLPEALGQKRSPLGIVVFVAGVLGASLALLFQWWTSAVDYPVRIGGKALFSWQAFVPIMFELMVLFAAFAAGLGMLFLLNRLPWFADPILNSKAMASTTRDRFALAVLAVGEELDLEAAESALREAGGEGIEVLHRYEPSSAAEPTLPLKEMAGIFVACLLAGTVMYQAVKWFPVLPPMNRMMVQKKVVPFRSGGILPAGAGMRRPVDGTVPRGMLPIPAMDAESAGISIVNPVPRTAEVFRQGREAYDTWCSVCHDPLGQGRSSLGEAYKAQPADLHGGTIRSYPDGRIFHVISEGRNAMPGYAGDIPVETRWSVVHYVRALQRALDAEEEDLP